MKGPSTAKMIGLLAGSTALAQLIVVAAMPIVLRLYSAEDMGLVAMYLAFFGWWAPNLSLRFEKALLIVPEDVDSHHIFYCALLFVLLMSILGMPILFLLQFFNILGFALLPSWTPFFAGLGFFGFGVFMVARSWALRAQLFKNIAKAAVYRSLANVCSRMIIGFGGGGLVGLLISEIAGAFASMSSLLIAVRSHFSQSRPDTFSLNSLVQCLRKYKKFPLYEAPSVWLDALAAALPLPIIGSLFGAEQAGLYAVATMIVVLPNTQIGAAVADVFQVKLSEAVMRSDRIEVQVLFRQWLTRLALVGLIPLVAVSLLAPLITGFVFGANWAPAGLYATLITPWYYAAFVVSPLSRAFSVLQAQEIKIFYDVLVLAILTGCYFAFTSTEIDIITAIAILSAGQFIGFIFYLYLIRYTVAKWAARV